MSVRFVTWNLERKKPTNPRGAEALDHVFGLDADVMVLTEARTSMQTATECRTTTVPPASSNWREEAR